MANVKGPTRPKNIKNTITNFPITERSDVTPKENPTVANAETDSNNNGKNAMVSVVSRIKNDTHTIKKAMVNMANALKIN